MINDGVCDGCGQVTKNPACFALETLLTALREPPGVAPLYEAVKYTLDRAQEDPDLGYYCGPGMQVFLLLCRAEAAHLGEPLEVVEMADARIEVGVAA